MTDVDATDEERRYLLRRAAKGPDVSWWFQQLRQALARALLMEAQKKPKKKAEAR